MQEVRELELEPLNEADLKYWSGLTSFDFWHAVFLLNDFRPKLVDGYRLPPRIEDSRRRLVEYISEHGHKELLDRWTTEYKQNPVFHLSGTPRRYKTVSVRKNIPAEPIPRDILKAAAEAMGLRPGILFPYEPRSEGGIISSGEPDDEGIMLYRLLAAMAIDYGYDPAAKKQGNGVMQSFQRMLQEQGWPDKQDRIKGALERAISKSGWKPRQS